MDTQNTITHAHTPNGGDERTGKQIERPSRSLLAVIVTLARAGVGVGAARQSRSDGGGIRREEERPI